MIFFLYVLYNWSCIFHNKSNFLYIYYGLITAIDGPIRICEGPISTIDSPIRTCCGPITAVDGPLDTSFFLFPFLIGNPFSLRESPNPTTEPVK